ncbi:COP9 signalosome complex subunit 8 [Dissostichus eleginoides]|nr:COP9 signalosome complex subunit 8 [Dissostichus eleginoides]
MDVLLSSSGVPEGHAKKGRSICHTKSTRQRAYSLVAQAYTSLAADDFAAFVGYSVEEAVKGVVSQGWQADPATRMVMPKKPDPPPVSLVPNEQQLARLTDYVAFLEN